MRRPVLRGLTVEGDAYAIGHALGAASARALRDVVPAADRFQALLREWRGTDRVRALEAAARAFRPRYVREIEGIAGGAGLPFETVFLWNCRGDLPGAGDEPRRAGVAAVGSTTVAIPRGGGDRAVVAHNEDGEPGLHGHCLVVDVRPDGAPGFVGFCSPGLLPGHAFAVNRAGLVQTVDDVRAEDRAVGAPRHLVCRAVLDSTCLDDAVACIRGAARASGVHHTLAQAGDARLLSVEAPASGCSVVEAGAPYAHANHLVHERLAHAPQRAGSSSRQRADPSSRSRQARAEALTAGGVVDGGDPLCVLGDVGADLPIRRRESDAGDPGFTLATAVFRIGGTGVAWEVFDELVHPPVHRGEVRPGPGSERLQGLSPK